VAVIFHSVKTAHIGSEENIKVDFRSLIGIIVLVIVLWLALDLLLAGGSMTGGMMGGMAGMMGSGIGPIGIFLLLLIIALLIYGRF